MVAPVRFTSGISTFVPRHIQNSFPSVPTQYQVSKGDDFIPFRQSTDYQATATGTGATAAQYSWNGGSVKITSGSTSTFKSFESLSGSASAAGSLQFIPGNQGWLDARIAVPLSYTASNGTAVTVTNPALDSAIYVGWFDTIDPSVATNGVYFIKAAASTALSFVVLKNSTATTFNNVGDLARPSGIYGGSDSSAGGILTANATGTTLSSLVVTAAGVGYNVAPLVVVNGTAGSGAQAYCQLGASSSNGIGGNLYAPYVTAPGSGYTAGTFTVDIIPFINVQFYYDGKGTLSVGVNGKTVLTLGKSGTLTATPGSTYNVATTGNSYNFSNTTLTAGVAPVQPFPGDFYVAAPQVPLQLGFGLIGTTGNNRAFWVEEINTATELN